MLSDDKYIYPDAWRLCSSPKLPCALGKTGLGNIINHTRSVDNRYAGSAEGS